MLFAIPSHPIRYDTIRKESSWDMYTWYPGVFILQCSTLSSVCRSLLSILLLLLLSFFGWLWELSAQWQHRLWAGSAGHLSCCPLCDCAICSRIAGTFSVFLNIPSTWMLGFARALISIWSRGDLWASLQCECHEMIRRIDNCSCIFN